MVDKVDKEIPLWVPEDFDPAIEKYKHEHGFPPAQETYIIGIPEEEAPPADTTK